MIECVEIIYKIEWSLWAFRKNELNESSYVLQPYHTLSLFKVLLLVQSYLSGSRDKVILYHLIYSSCVEGLSSILKNVARNGSIRDCYNTPAAPSVTHLLFTDDSFLFFKVTSEETNSIKKILHSYEIFSGQAVNYQKSVVFFSANVRRDKQVEIKRILWVSNDVGESKYQGLPSLISR